MSGMSGQNPEKSGINAVEREEVSTHPHQLRFLGETLGKSSGILVEYYDIARIQL